MKAKAFLIAFLCIITAMSAGCGTREEDPDTDVRPSGEAVGNNAAEATKPPAAPTEPLVQQSRNSGLSMDEATEIARQNAGVAEDQVQNLRVLLESEGEDRQYEVSFRTADREYRYRIEASDGTILEKSVDIISAAVSPSAPGGTSGPAGTASGSGTASVPSGPAPSAGAQPSAGLTQDEAVGIAAKDAGVAVNELRGLQVKLDYEDGIQVYEIEFEAGSTEYEYEIAVSDGTIRKRDIEQIDSVPGSTSGGGAAGIGGTSGPSGSGTASAPSGPAPSAGLTQDEAVGIAARDAGVAVNELGDLHVELHYEDGIQVYEIEFENGGMKYECEIAVSDGTIRERDMERIDSVPGSTSGGGAVEIGGTSGPAGAASGSGTASAPSGSQPSAGLTQDEAVGIAAKDAGVAVNELWDLHVELDYEDGIRVYEIEFETGSAEYEYKIAVSDGMILEREIDDDFYCGDHHHHHHHH